MTLPVRVHFDPSDYGPTVAALLQQSRLAELGPGQPAEDMRSQLETVEAPTACRAGLWLYFDFLHESHEISQELHTPEGSYWHAIMHRREPDAANSKYWFRQVGPHPVQSLLVAEAAARGYAYTTPFAFIDVCERLRGTASPGEEQARQIQLLEWQLLFAHCWAADRSRSG